MENKKEHFISVFTKKAHESDIVKRLYANSAYCMAVDNNVFSGIMPDNFRNMFLNGRGNELTGKACAVYSSSMLSYNFFHWISPSNPLYLFGHQYTKVYFEVQLPTLQGSTPANMDVVLEEIHQDGKRTLLFIESKFTEHFSNANSKMMEMSKNSYSKRNNKFPYYPSNGKCFETWRSIIKKFADESQTNEGYYDGIKQEICHFLALSNLKADSKACKDYKELYKGKSEVEHPTINGDEEFLFYNILFDAAECFFESDKFVAYQTLYKKLQSELSSLNNNITAEIHSYRDIFDSIKDSKTVPQNLISYLNERYMQYSKQSQCV